MSIKLQSAASDIKKHNAVKPLAASQLVRCFGRDRERFRSPCPLKTASKPKVESFVNFILDKAKSSGPNSN
jgi:hypothetical protein